MKIPVCCTFPFHSLETFLASLMELEWGSPPLTPCESGLSPRVLTATSLEEMLFLLHSESPQGPAG